MILTTSQTLNIHEEKHFSLLKIAPKNLVQTAEKISLTTELYSESHYTFIVQTQRFKITKLAGRLATWMHPLL